MEQLVKDSLQIGFSFFVAAYLLIVMTNLIRELREQFIQLRSSIDKLILEIRDIARSSKKDMDKGSPP